MRSCKKFWSTIIRKVSSSLLFYFLLFCSEPFQAQAQKLKLNVYGSHVADVRVDYNMLTGDVKQNVINHGYQTGGGFEWTIKKQITAELLFLHQSRTNTKLATSSVSGSSYSTNLDFAMVSFGVDFS